MAFEYILIYIYIVFVQAGQLRMFLLFSHPAKSDLYDPVKSDLFMTPWAAAHQASLCLTVSWSLPKFMSITSMMPSSYLILWCPLLLHSVFPNIRDFSNEASACIWWPKYWSFSFHIRPSNEYSGLIFLKTDLFDLLAVQGTCRSLLQHHSLKASILWRSASLQSSSHNCTWPLGRR